MKTLLRKFIESELWFWNWQLIDEYITDNQEDSYAIYRHRYSGKLNHRYFY